MLSKLFAITVGIIFTAMAIAWLGVWSICAYNFIADVLAYALN